jgi:hypothetical protein
MGLAFRSIGPEMIFTSGVLPDRARDDDGWMKNGCVEKWVHNDNRWMMDEEVGT